MEEHGQQYRAAIQSQYDRFTALYTGLEQRGFKEGPQLVQFALSLSKLDDEVDDIFGRVQTADTMLFPKNKEDYGHLPALANIVAQKGDIRELAQEMGVYFQQLVAQGFQRSYATSSVATAIMRIPGSKTQKYARFNETGQMLDAREWRARDILTAYAAATIASKSGSPQEVAHELISLEQRIKHETLIQTPDSVIPALILYQSSDTARVDKFAATVIAMEDAGFGIFSTDKSNYAVAASVSLLPGTPEEHVKLLSHTMRLFDTDRRSGTLQNAIQIVHNVGATYARPSMEETRPPDETPSFSLFSPLHILHDLFHHGTGKINEGFHGQGGSFGGAGASFDDPQPWDQKDRSPADSERRDKIPLRDIGSGIVAGLGIAATTERSEEAGAERDSNRVAVEPDRGAVEREAQEDRGTDRAADEASEPTAAETSESESSSGSTDN